MAEYSKVIPVSPSDSTQTISFGATCKRFSVENLGYKEAGLFFKKTGGTYNVAPYYLPTKKFQDGPEDFELATDEIKIDTLSKLELVVIFEEA